MNYVKYRFHVILVGLLVLLGLICCQTSEKYTSDPTTVYFEHQDFNRITTLDKFSLVDFTVPEKPMLFHIIRYSAISISGWVPSLSIESAHLLHNGYTRKLSARRFMALRSSLMICPCTCRGASHWNTDFCTRRPNCSSRLLTLRHRFGLAMS